MSTTRQFTGFLNVEFFESNVDHSLYIIKADREISGMSGNRQGHM